MNGNFLLQAVVFLTAAVVCVPLAKRLGLSSVLGYLLAGILIGPFLLGFIGDEGKDLMHFAEFGVVMMLFLIGLELEPAKFWQMRKIITGMGFSQMAGTALIAFLLLLLLNFTWQVALALGLSLAMSSTAIVLQSLKEKGLSNTAAGQSSFAILLFQDIAVIPILAFLPLLAVQSVNTPGDNGHHSLLADLPGWMQTLAVLVAVGLVVMAGRYLIVPLLRMIAKTQLRELFTGFALLIVVGIALLMEFVGLSPALGTFLAGVVLANSEYRHELESDLEPFKGLLLGLFFMTVGASIDFTLIGGNPGLVFAYVAGIMVIKTLVLLVIGYSFRLSLSQNIIFALGLSQVGEFAFVLISFIGQLNIISGTQEGLFLGVTAISMTMTPLLLLAADKLVLPRLQKAAPPAAKDDVFEAHNPVIIAGFSHFGSTIGRFLRANGIEATILDNDSDRVNLLRKLGFKVYFGDATRVDVLKSAGAEQASILITAIDTLSTNLHLLDTIGKHFPHLQILIRTRHRYDAYELIEKGTKEVYRESIDTSIRLGVDVLKKLGFRSYTATRAGQNFLKYDEEALVKLTKERHNMKQYICKAREEIDLQEQLLKSEHHINPTDNDHAWDSDFMRESILKNEAKA